MTGVYDNFRYFSGLNSEPSLASHSVTIEERRSKARYPLHLSVRFRSVSKGFLFSGLGRIIDMSSGGVLVVLQDVSQHEISVGAWVEISIEWPALLEGRIPLQLVAAGRIIRRGASDFAVTFERHEFRTMKGPHHPFWRGR